MTKSLDDKIHKILDLFFGEKDIKPLFFYTLSIIFILFGLSVQPLQSILEGYWTILVSPSNLITDYFKIGGIGATFINVGSLMLVNTRFVQRNSKMITGPLLAAIFTVMGFSFFGKNLYNTIPFIIGTYAYSKYSDQPVSSYLLGALFSSALGPVVSIITFGQGLPFYIGAPIGILVGILIGFIIHPVSSSFLRFHQGFNLYNVGFTAGVIGLVVTSIMRVFALPVTYNIENRSFSSLTVTIFFVVLSLVLLFLGFILNGYSFKYYAGIRHASGRLISDFVTDFGTGLTLINMGLLGILSIGYVHIVGGHLDGAVVGGVLTIVGFAGFGKHPFNVIPVVAGIYMMQAFMHIDDPNSTSSLLSALFGTTLAPIAGNYGWLAGILAGSVHAAVVQNTGDAHAGLNLYNNGFAGGFVAAFLVPVLDVIKERINKNERIH